MRSSTHAVNDLAEMHSDDRSKNADPENALGQNEISPPWVDHAQATRRQC
eukprot:m.269928 g.269928  ORF g.269928 m.269928 type:complete len:50 (+) comp16071_c0_seq3:142-291(+)